MKINQHRSKTSNVTHTPTGAHVRFVLLWFFLRDEQKMLSFTVLFQKMEQHEGFYRKEQQTYIINNKRLFRFKDCAARNSNGVYKDLDLCPEGKEEECSSDVNKLFFYQ